MTPPAPPPPPIEYMLQTLIRDFDAYKREQKESQEVVRRSLDGLAQVVQSGQAPLTTRVAVVEERVSKLNSQVGWVATASLTSAFGIAAALVITVITRGF